MISDNIKKYRLLNGMEQKDLAKKLNVSDKTVSSWECGRTEPKIGMVEAIAEAFGITKTELIDGSTDKAPYSPRIRDFIARLQKLPPDYQNAVFDALQYQEYLFAVKKETSIS